MWWASIVLVNDKILLLPNKSHCTEQNKLRCKRLNRLDQFTDLPKIFILEISRINMSLVRRKGTNSRRE